MNTLQQLLYCIISNQQSLNALVLQLKNYATVLAVSFNAGASANNEKLHLALHATHVADITGYKIRTARKMLREVRVQLGKPPRSLVTVKEFAAATKIPLKDIFLHI